MLYFYVCKYEYLLRDVKFTLKTDHANLLYLNVPPSNKVLRWKLAIQEYDIDVEHIAGVKNIVADSFSRLLDATKVPIGDVLAISDDHESEADHSARTPLPAPVYDLIAGVHNSWIGHRGIDATCKLLTKEGASWKGMMRDVSKFIRQCPTCQSQVLAKSHTIPSR